MGVLAEWRGLPIRPTRAAMNELFNEGLDLLDVRQVLEEGFDCSESRRKEGVLERCLHKRGRVFKAVVAEGYSYSMKQDCWVLVHLKSVKSP